MVGRHRQLSCCSHDPLEVADNMRAAVIAFIQTRPSDYLIASEDEVLLDAQECARKRGVEFLEGCTDLWYLLLEREQKAVLTLDEQYWVRFNADPCEDADLCYFLGDSPEYSRTWSAVSGKIPTFRMNSRSGKYWFPMFRRWLTAKERLALMGFPVIPEMACALKVGVFPSLDVHRASDVCGNAMHFSSTALMQLVALSCFGPCN